MGKLMGISDAFNKLNIARGLGVLSFSGDKPSPVVDGVSGPITPPSFFTEVMLDSPFFYARMDDEVSSLICVDIIAGRNGAYVGSPTLEVQGALQNDTNTAVLFDAGQNHRAEDIGGLSDFAFIHTNGVFTVEAFVKFTTISGAQTLISNADATEKKGFILLMDNIGPSPLWRLTVYKGTTGIQAVSVATTGGPPIKTGQWYHVIAKGDGVDAKLYIDGILLSTSAFVGLASGDATELVKIGIINDGVGLFFPLDGVADEVLIYDTTLSDARISAHYLATLSQYKNLIFNSDRQSFWYLSERSGAIAFDHINQINGSINGTPLLAVPGLVDNDTDNAMLFRAVNTEYIASIGQNADYSFIQNTSIFVVEMWVAFTDLNIRRELIGNATQSSIHKGFRVLYFGDIAGALSIQVLHAVSDDYTLQLTTANNIIPDNQKHHLVITADGVNGYMYLDGVQVATNAVGTLSTGDSTDNLAIGASHIGGNSFNGIIDDVSIGPLYATPIEVLALFNAGTNTDYFDLINLSSPFSYHRMDDVDSICKDIIAGLNGTYINNPSLQQIGALKGDNNAAASFLSAGTEYVSDVGGVADYAFIQNTAVFTVELWVKFDGFSVRRSLLGNFTSSGAKGFTMSYESNDTFYFAGLRGVVGQTVFAVQSAPGLLTDTINFHHFLATSDGITARLYLDGVEIGNAPVTALSSGNSTGAMYFASGNNGGSPSETLSGDLDEIAIYTTFMDAATVLAHFNTGKRV